MSGIAREEKLFLAIGGVPEDLVEEAMDPRASLRRKPSPLRWAAMAAAFAVVAGVSLYSLLPRMGGANGGVGDGIRGDHADPGSSITFMSYAGPALPLTVVDGPEGLPARREVTWDFGLTVDAEKHSLYRAEVTDTTVITNDRAEDLTITVGYPVTASLDEDKELLPTLTVNGQALETELLWGDTGRGALWENPRLESWESCKEILEDGSYLAEAQKEAPALEQTVTVWELTDSTAPAVDTSRMAPTLAIRFRIDEEKTQVFTLGFNGASFGENGERQYDYFVPQQNERGSRRLLVFLGEVPEEYTMAGYENGGCEKPLEGVSARMTAFTTTLGTLLDQLVEEDLAQWREGVLDRLEEVRAAVRRLVARILLPVEEPRYDNYMLEDVLSYAAVATRVVWTTGEVTIPAGGDATVTVRYQKKPSYDFACGNTQRQGLRGWDLGTGLGSNLEFREITARLENTEHLVLEGQNFGFDLPGGVTQVELDPKTEYYYMEVRLKEE